MLGNQWAHASLAADHNDDALRRIELIQVDSATCDQTNRPVTDALELLQRTRRVGDAADGQQRGGAGGGDFDGGGNADGAVLGDEHCTGADGLGGAQDRAQIVGILDLVGEHQQLWRWFDDAFELGVRERRRRGDDTLMARRAGHSHQGLVAARLLPHLRFGGELKDRGDAIGEARVVVHTVHLRGVRLQPRRDRMDAVDAAGAGARCAPWIYKVSAFHYHSSLVRIINRYILREILVPFALGLAVFTLILLIARILKLVEMVVNRGVPLLEVLKLFSYILPAFLEVTVPMALLLAVIVAFGRLSSDSEIIALKTSGVSLYQLVRPVALFAIVIYVVALGLSLYARPWGNSLLRNGLYEIAKTRASAGIKEKVFTDDFSGLVIYVDRIEPPGNTLRGILISDTRDPTQHNTVFAEVGLLVPNEALHVLVLRLLSGTIHAFYPEDRSYHRTEFSIYDISLDLNTALAKLQPREKDPSEMTVPELRAAMATKRAAGQPANSEAVELQRKFSIPFACLAFAAIGVPIGIRPSRSARSRGFTMSLTIIFAYYVLLSMGESLGERGVLSAAVALWIPNVLLTALAVVLFGRAAREGGPRRSGMLGSWVLSLRLRLAALAGSKSS